MNLTNKTAEIFVPDGADVPTALARTTHLAVGAHQDDLEIFGMDGILKCFGRTDRWFTGVTVTNGSGSPRADLYADFSDEQMMAVRRQEQKKAAYVGEYGAQLLLDYSSAAIKDGADRNAVEDLKEVLAAARPQVVYTHNPADKHDTHVGVLLKTIAALRELPAEARPREFYGVEVWRDLDWVNDDDKVAFDVSGHDNVAQALVGIFDSQVCGGKRYDLATMGRRRAHATYATSHGVDEADYLIYGLDLMPLIKDPEMTLQDLVAGHIQTFQADVSDRISRLS